MFNLNTIAAVAAEKEQIDVPSIDGLRTLLTTAQKEKSLVTWAEAYKAAGFDGAFRNNYCARLINAAREVVEGGDALIVGKAGNYNPKVAQQHVTTLRAMEYPEELIAFIVSQTKKVAQKKAARAENEKKAFASLLGM